MRFRFPLIALFLVLGAFAIPHLAHASIPFFGPIIPEAANRCAAGWGAVMQVINNIIEFSITIIIVFIAPIMIAYSGFLYVVNPVDPSGIKKAKDILTNTVLGLIIALAGWLIVDAVMAVLYNPTNPGETWSDLVTSGGMNFCLSQAGTMPGDTLTTDTASSISVVPSTCSISALTPITDPLALQMEASNGNAIIWTNVRPQLQACVNKFISKVGGTVTSVYRPQAYQTHLSEIHERWCTQNLKDNSNPLCSTIKSDVSAEVSKHGLSACMPVATNSGHTGGYAVDITGVNQSLATLQVLNQSCLSWFGPSDKVHYTLQAACVCY